MADQNQDRPIPARAELQEHFQRFDRKVKLLERAIFGLLSLLTTTLIVVFLVSLLISIGLLPSGTFGIIRGTTNPEVAARSEQLRRTADDLRELAIFVEAQRQNVELVQRRIEQLEQERSALEPAVEADRQALEAILQVQVEK